MTPKRCDERLPAPVADGAAVAVLGGRVRRLLGRLPARVVRRRALAGAVRAAAVGTSAARPGRPRGHRPSTTAVTGAGPDARNPAAEGGVESPRDVSRRG